MRRVWRWALRLLIVLVCLLVALAVAVQVVLGTGVPRRLVIGQLERNLALRFGAESVRTGWLGNTELTDVSVALPLASNSLLKVKSVRVKHTNLLGILATQDVTLSSIELDEPELVVQQDEAGQWNIVQAMQLVGRALGAQQVEKTAQANKPQVTQIPRVVLKDGTLRVIDRTGRTASVQPLNIVGQPAGSLVWQYEATAGPTDAPQLHVVGQLVPGGDWQHEVAVTLKNEAGWVRPWVTGEAARDLVDKTVVKLNWYGHETPAGVSGRLEVQDVRAGPYTASGPVNVEFDGSALHARPTKLMVNGIAGIPSGVELRAGEIRLDGAAVQMHDLIATVAAGDVRLNGQYGLKDQATTVTADWNGLQLPEGYEQRGSMTFNLRTDWTGLLQADARVASVSSSTVPKAVAWDAAVSLHGAGNTFREIDWAVTADRLRVKQGTLDANLDQLTARLTNTPTEVVLSSLSVPAGQLTPDRPRGTLRGSGRYFWPDAKSAKGGDWYVNVWGEGWRVFDRRDVTANFNLDANGDLNAPRTAPERGEWAQLNEFYAETNTGIRAWAGGKVSYEAAGMPADLWIYTWYPPFALQGYTEQTELQGGEFSNRVHVAGGAYPPALQLYGTLHGTSVLIGNHPVGDVSMAMTGEMRGKDFRDYTVSMRTDHLKLFEGDWDLNAHYAAKTGDATVDVKLERMSATALAQFVKNPAQVGGTVSGQWTVVLPKLDLSRSTVDGDFNVADVRAPLFAADSITGHLSTNPQTIVLSRIRVLRNLGGQIDASLSFPVANPTQLAATVNAAAWPLQLPDASLLIFAQTAAPAAIDLKTLSANGPFKVDVYPILHGVDCGVVHTRGEMAGRRVSLTQIDAEGFGGRIGGVASYDLDNPLNARADLHWQDLDATKLSAFWTTPTPTTIPTTTGPTTQPGELYGRVSGTAQLGTPTAPRPLAPLQLTVVVNGKDLAWRTTKIDGGLVNVFYNPISQHGERRFVVDDSALNFAGGTARVFARLSRHPLPGAELPDSVRRATQPTSTWAFNLSVDADRLDLNQLAHSGDKAAKDQPGRVQLHTTLLGNPFDRRTWVGEGTARLSESDLAQNAIIGALYSIMSVRFGNKVPEGRGSASFHFEGEDLRIDSFYFTQRGVEARGNGTVSSVWTVPDSPIDGFIAGSIRPLRDLKLPFAADLDRIISLLQRNLTVVQVSGTLREPKIQQKTFADIGQGLKQFILNDLLGNNTAEQ